MMNLTVLVHFEPTDSCNGNFIVYDMRTGEKKIIRAPLLFGTTFKMKSDFNSTFRNAFPGKKRVVYTETAEQEVNILMEFNRVDS